MTFVGITSGTFHTSMRMLLLLFLLMMMMMMMLVVVVTSRLIATNTIYVCVRTNKQYIIMSRYRGDLNKLESNRKDSSSSSTSKHGLHYYKRTINSEKTNLHQYKYYFDSSFSMILFFFDVQQLVVRCRNCKY
jgi:hypothetical protein